jgi:type IV secretion system protein VirB9
VRPGAQQACATGLAAFASFLAAGLPVAGQAQAMLEPPQTSSPGALHEASPQILVLGYVTDAVYRLHGHYGYQFTIELAPGERIENVAVGDSVSWQVTPNRRGDTLFVKPMEYGAATNMAVLTNVRRYAFELTAGDASGPGDPTILFRVRFTYPAPPAPAGQPALPLSVNAAYSVFGSLQNLPSRVFDDGVQTWFEWPAGAAVPAVFALDADGNETLVNFAFQDGRMVIDTVRPAFALRNGSERTVIRNQAWREPDPGPAAPQAARPDRPPGLLDRLFGRDRNE